MANICFDCGKTTVVGSSQKHRRGVAGKRWMKRVPPTARLFKPNLQVKTIEVGGKLTKVKLCAKCIKRRNFKATHSFLTA